MYICLHMGILGSVLRVDSSQSLFYFMPSWPSLFWKIIRRKLCTADASSYDRPPVLLQFFSWFYLAGIFHWNLFGVKKQITRIASSGLTYAPRLLLGGESLGTKKAFESIYSPI